jgi:hypothetical protein
MSFMHLQETDQPLMNGNPNFIAVPTRNINLVPTDIRGLTFSRTPQQVRFQQGACRTAVIRFIIISYEWVFAALAIQLPAVQQSIGNYASF